jgi:hypothetical protein
MENVKSSVLKPTLLSIKSHMPTSFNMEKSYQKRKEFGTYSKTLRIIPRLQMQQKVPFLLLLISGIASIMLSPTRPRHSSSVCLSMIQETLALPIPLLEGMEVENQTEQEEVDVRVGEDKISIWELTPLNNGENCPKGTSKRSMMTDGDLQQTEITSKPSHKPVELREEEALRPLLCSNLNVITSLI